MYMNGLYIKISQSTTECKVQSFGLRIDHEQYLTLVLISIRINVI